MRYSLPVDQISGRQKIESITNMNNGNILFAIIGGLAVASVWAIASVSLTAHTFMVGLSVYAVIATLLVAFQDYDHNSKSLL
ncbi:MAG: hypothetical protein ACKVI3_05930 [Verrucomicrobiia bacterium]